MNVENQIELVTQGRRFPSPLLTELRPSPTTPTQVSSVVEVAPFDRAVLSWNGTGNYRLELRLRIGSEWTPYALMGVIEGNKSRSAQGTEADLPGNRLPVELEIDTLLVRGETKASAFQVRATGKGKLTALAVTHYQRSDSRYTESPTVPKAWGTILDVPQRAQRDVENPDIGGEVCSPTSVAMALEYHGKKLRTVDVAWACRDEATKIYGNWSVNAAVAARILGGWSVVVKLRGFDEIEREISEKRPVVLSHRWERGDLSNAPISRSNGHLILVIGFTEDGDIVVNDPAGKSDSVRRIYTRRELFYTWQKRGEGIVYIIQP
jgi:uncharacterized protein YvpB